MDDESCSNVSDEPGPGLNFTISKERIGDGEINTNIVRQSLPETLKMKKPGQVLAISKLTKT